MSWSPQQIRDLRLRLGWSTAEFGRRLGCSGMQIQSWEKGIGRVDSKTTSQLIHLSSQVERHAQRMAMDPLAEMIMDQGDLSQVTRDHLL